MERHIIRTGVGGYDLFSEAMEREGLGTERIYMPKKCTRILKFSFKYKSASGRLFKRLKINLVD